MAVLIIVAMLMKYDRENTMSISPKDGADAPEAVFARAFVEAVRQHGWRVQQEQKVEGDHADIIFANPKRVYLAQIKRSSEGRRDRLVPLLSQAILQAQQIARDYIKPAVAVAVVAAPRVPESVAEELRRFAAKYAPDVAVGVMDAEGFRAFSGQGLEVLNAARRSTRSPISSRKALSSRLFSDLNRWMLKVLLSENIPEGLLSAPRGPYRNASQLAEAAGVSVMSAYRFIRDMSREGFIEEHSSGLRVVRINALLQRWIAESQGMVNEHAARWILPSGKDQLITALRAYMSQPNGGAKGKRNHQEQAQPPQQVCLGLFAAADALGMGIVRGVPHHFYVRDLNDDFLQKLGLSVLPGDSQPDVYVRVPRYPESVFRGAVEHEKVGISDILQVWLDVSNFPARGKAQADTIYKRVAKLLMRGEER